MSAPKPNLTGRLENVRGLKSLLAVVAVVLIYYWASAGLGISLGQFTSGETWRQMASLVIQMGPYDMVNNCRNAQLAWGPDDPIAEKSDPAKVKAVCEEGKTLYLYQYGHVKQQFRYMKQVWDPLMTTFRMAILGAFLGAVLAIPFSMLSARNLVKSKPLYYTVRTVLSLIRTIPDLLLAAILTGMLGLGALPAVTALAIFSFALIAKLASESIEAIDAGPLEAMQACGANWLQQIRYGVIPQILPQFMAYTLYVLEVDVRASMVLGLVGAGGIGQLLMMNLNLMIYRNVGAVVFVLLIAVLLVDYVSITLRERLI